MSNSIVDMASKAALSNDKSRGSDQLAEQMNSQIEIVGMQANTALERVTLRASRFGVIRKIANTTNTLARHAAVEGARAGEHGRGFSVVATEVG